MKRKDISEIKFVFGSEHQDKKIGRFIQIQDMNTFNDLLTYREQISKMIEISTDGEINDFDFIVDHLTMGGRPSRVHIMLGVPGKVKKEYNGDMNALLDKHQETIRQVVSSFGFPELFSRTIRWSIL